MKKYGKDVRKVVQIGNCQGVTLPKNFLKRHDLELGDQVEIVFNNVLKITPLQDTDIQKELGEKG